MDQVVTPAPAVPEGFRLLRDVGGFISLVGPYYRRKGSEGVAEYGFMSEARHANPNGVLHGGSITTFMDTVLGYEVMRVTRRPCATITLDTKFVSGGRPGDWVLGRVNVRRVTRSMVFLDGEVYSGEALIVLVSGVFKLFPAPEPRPESASIG